MTKIQNIPSIPYFSAKDHDDSLTGVCSSSVVGGKISSIKIHSIKKQAYTRKQDKNETSATSVRKKYERIADEVVIPKEYRQNNDVSKKKNRLEAVPYSLPFCSFSKSSLNFFRRWSSLRMAILAN